MKKVTVLYKNIETYPKGIAALSLEQLKKLSDRNWYVRFRFYDTRSLSWKLIIRKCGINYKELSLKERKEQLIALKEAIEYKLKIELWHPITNTYEDRSQEFKRETYLSTLRNM